MHLERFHSKWISLKWILFSRKRMKQWYFHSFFFLLFWSQLFHARHFCATRNRQFNCNHLQIVYYHPLSFANQIKVNLQLNYMNHFECKLQIVWCVLSDDIEQSKTWLIKIKWIKRLKVLHVFLSQRDKHHTKEWHFRSAKEKKKRSWRELHTSCNLPFHLIFLRRKDHRVFFTSAPLVFEIKGLTRIEWLCAVLTQNAYSKSEENPCPINAAINLSIVFLLPHRIVCARKEHNNSSADMCLFSV